jgi:endonuclease IV
MDRHANIGEGHIGAAGFRRILAHPRLRVKPFILETPNDNDGDDRRNVEMLQSLWRAQAKRAPTGRAKPGRRSGASRRSVS